LTHRTVIVSWWETKTPNLSELDAFLKKGWKIIDAKITSERSPNSAGWSERIFTTVVYVLESPN